MKGDLATLYVDSNQFLIIDDILGGITFNSDITAFIIKVTEEQLSKIMYFWEDKWNTNPMSDFKDYCQRVGNMIFGWNQ